MSAFFKRPLHRIQECAPSVRIALNSRKQKSKKESLEQFFNKNRSKDEQFAEYHERLLKCPVIPPSNWPDVILAWVRRGKIVRMSAKQGVPLYRGTREYYLNRHVEEVFPVGLGQRMKTWGEEACRSNRMKVKRILIEKGGKWIMKELCFYSLQGIILVCAKHLPCTDSCPSMFRYQSV